MCVVHTRQGRTCDLYLFHWSCCPFWNSLILESFFQQGWNPYIHPFMCVSSFLSLCVTYVYNLIKSLFSGASLGPAPARRLFLRGNFLI